jgi:hypothetical protein
VWALLLQTPYSKCMANNNKTRKPGAGPVARTTARPGAKAAAKPSEEISRAQRLLGYVGGSLLGFGILALIALLLGESFAVESVQQNIGIWGVVAFIPDIAIPVGFVLMIVLLILSFVKRSRAAEGAGK